MPNLKKCQCGRYNSQTAEFCSECGEALGEFHTEKPSDEMFDLIGKPTGWVLMILTGFIVKVSLIGLVATSSPVGIILVLGVGALIWFGICRAFRNNSPSTMRVLRWLFPYDSWTSADD